MTRPDNRQLYYWLNSRWETELEMLDTALRSVAEVHARLGKQGPALYLLSREHRMCADALQELNRLRSLLVDTGRRVDALARADRDVDFAPAYGGMVAMDEWLDQCIYEFAGRLDRKQHLRRAAAARCLMKHILLEQPAPLRIMPLYKKVAEELGGDVKQVERVLRSFSMAAREAGSQLYREHLSDIPQNNATFYAHACRLLQQGLPPEMDAYLARQTKWSHAN